MKVNIGLWFMKYVIKINQYRNLRANNGLNGKKCLAVIAENIHFIFQYS